MRHSYKNYDKYSMLGLIEQQSYDYKLNRIERLKTALIYNQTLCPTLIDLVQPILDGYKTELDELIKQV